MEENIIKKILVFCFFTAGFNLYSESVFTYDLKKDVVISSLSLGILFGGYKLNDEPSMPYNLNRNNVNAFDRWLMFPRNEPIHIARDKIRNGLLVLPAITPLVGGMSDFNTYLTYGIMYAEAVSLTYGICTLIRKPVTRYRPELYFEPVENPVPDAGFPSDTVAAAFISATFLSATYSTEYPDSPWKIPIIVGSHTLAASIGVMSILCGFHFLSDILVGAALGSFCGWLIPTLHRRINNEDKISFYFTGNGGIISLKL